MRRWRREGFDAIYGDASDPELIATLPLAGPQWVVSTTRDQPGGVSEADARLVLIQTLRAHGFRGRIAVTSGHESGDALLQARAELVLEPFQDAADRAVDLLEWNESPDRIEVLEPEDQKEIGV